MHNGLIPPGGILASGEVNVRGDERPSGEFTTAPWLVVFDLDGTLIDSSRDLCLAVNAAMMHVGARQLPDATITSFVGDGASVLIRRSLGIAEQEGSEPAEDVARFRAAFSHFLHFYRVHKLDNTRLYEGVLPALRAIREASPLLPMAVLTNKPVNPAREICAALGLEPFLFAVRGGDSFATKKPDPSGLQSLMREGEAILRERGADPGSLQPAGVVMVGDSDVDVLTARGAGAVSLGCTFGLAPASLQAAAPDLICDSPFEWPSLLLPKG